MTLLIAAIIVAVLFVLAGGALAGIRPWIENRASSKAIALQEQQAQTAAREADIESRRAAADAQMRTDPVPVLVATLARYDEQVRIPRAAAVDAANVVRAARDQEYKEESEQLPQSLLKPGTTRYAILAAVPLFVLGSLVAGVLDFMTFRGFSGGLTLPILLSVLTVLIMTVSSVLIGLGMGWHKGLAGAEWSRSRRGMIARAGVVFAVAGLAAMVWIAPNRTSGFHDAEVKRQTSILAQAENTRPQTDQTRAAATTARQAVDKAKSDKTLAAAVDRVSVGGITFLEIPLTEGMLFGVQVLLAFRAQQRRDEARRRHQEAVNAFERAESRLDADLLELLAGYGHGSEQLRAAKIRWQQDKITRQMLDEQNPNGRAAPEPAAASETTAPAEGNAEGEPDGAVPPPKPASPRTDILDGLDEMNNHPHSSEPNS
ncbi:hypothetical protein ACFXHA_03315 [Nocardia sp. NPDC059240]|uniref:hypothetical protein n=1 Tax=Nocardia sp. NPDC059240 TaxID=3346786 RepID=UPI0036BD6FE7